MMQRSKLDLRNENRALRQIVSHLHWMARRYADNRRSYVTSLFNGCTRELLEIGVPLNWCGDDILWARDQSGHLYDELSTAERTPGTHEARGQHYANKRA